MFLMPTTNIYGMADDFGKDIIKAVRINKEDVVKTDINTKDLADITFAVNSDATTVIDAPKVGVKLEKERSILDNADMGLGEIDVDDFNVTTWKDLKEEKYIDKARFYVFPNNNKEFEVDGLVFIGKYGAKAANYEEAVYVIDQWMEGDKLFVEYLKYPESRKEIREVDFDDRLAETNIREKMVYVGKEKANGKLALYGKLGIDEKTEDFKVYRHKTVTRVNGNYITVSGSDQKFLIVGSLVHDGDKLKTSSFIKKDMVIDIVSDGINIRLIGVVDKSSKIDK